jgi:membrane-associated phospholipid phosphatase
MNRALLHVSRAALLAFAAAAPALSQGSIVLDWNDAALTAIRTAGTAPPPASRHLAILHAAIHDAVNGVERRYEQYLVQPNLTDATSAAAAATSAARDVLVALYASQTASFDALNLTILATIADGAPKTRGIAWGQEVARQILAARSADGSTNTAPYPGSNDPGKWRPHVSFGGIVRPALLPLWGKVAPFVLQTGSQLRPPPPPQLSSVQYAIEQYQVQNWGRATNSQRTPDQTEIALFWGYGPGTATPPGHWNQIAHEAIASRGGTLGQNARVLALLNLALADAAIVSWDSKYEYGFWRPVTAIPLADTDGNPFTDPEPGWTPLLATPPFPEYTSGHSTFSGAAAAVLAYAYGDRHRFTVGSDDLPNVTRSYRTFSEAAWESGLSRIYGGIHYMSGNIWGLLTGYQVGLLTSQTRLRPVRG